MDPERDSSSRLIADSTALELFVSQPPSERHLTGELRGVLAETALTGILRYPWHLLKPLIATQIKQLLQDFQAAEQVDVGPMRPLPFGETLEGCYEILAGYLDKLAHAPFTIQRLCELVLEPQKQYSRLDKVVVAIEKLLMVISTVPVDENVPGRPYLAALRPVNENPRKVEMTGPGSGCLPFSVRPSGRVPGSVPTQGLENVKSEVVNVGGEIGIVSSVMAVKISSEEEACPGD